ncbi:MAG: hypothetical protein NTX64_09430 [Elusimicrobia bacterium]|nr:hypothetical protein [Elusimicrobiota bacterium]
MHRLLAAGLLALSALARAADFTIEVKEGTRPLDPAQLETLRSTLAELTEQVPGVLDKVVIEERPFTPTLVTWGAAGKNQLWLNRVCFDHVEGLWMSVAAHEFGHLAMKRFLPPLSKEAYDWIDLFSQMFLLEMKGSKILKWFAENRFSLARVCADVPYDEPPNDSELFAIAFAVRFLWPDQFASSLGSPSTREQELVARVFAALPVRPRRAGPPSDASACDDRKAAPPPSARR